MPIHSHKEWHINLGLSITYHKLYPKAQCKTHTHTHPKNNPKNLTNKCEWDIKGILFMNEF